ncbi:MAG: hypothetical protein DWI29_00675 [Planctomycetota bacterium]|nr:MAG: hypothetical protein DWI29_00675 [Planctomycetota bacterium]
MRQFLPEFRKHGRPWQKRSHVDSVSRLANNSLAEKMGNSGKNSPMFTSCRWRTAGNNGNLFATDINPEPPSVELPTTLFWDAFHCVSLEIRKRKTT